MLRADFHWERGKQIGWDITVGRWAETPGGLGTVWNCPQQATSYVGNARALGLDHREVEPDGPVHIASRSKWSHTGRLVLCYDVQYNLLSGRFANATDPAAADLSDENDYPWPYDGEELPLWLPYWGPHGERYGILFADGHAVCKSIPGQSEAVLWAGPRWWPDPRQ
ncbi:MAG: hypothetical protein CHACPFDD_03778 [Phycisphaerae bacterium]|nr:hypothetical protein [Phycisphaerae bacterium]